MNTILDVAKKAGVSAMTVSRYFNQPDMLAPATRDRVGKAIEQLQYVPNAAARSLVIGRTNTVALILSDITNPFYTTLARGAEDRAQEHGYTLILGNSDESLEKERRYLDVLISRRVDGVLIASSPGNAMAAGKAIRYSPRSCRQPSATPVLTSTSWSTCAKRCPSSKPPDGYPPGRLTATDEKHRTSSC